MNIAGNEIMNGQFGDPVPDARLTAPLSIDTFPPPEIEQVHGLVGDGQAASPIERDVAEVNVFDSYAAIRALAENNATAARLARLANRVL